MTRNPFVLAVVASVFFTGVAEAQWQAPLQPCKQSSQDCGFACKTCALEGFHLGVDFSAEAGQTVVAPHEGILEDYTWQNFYGAVARIRGKTPNGEEVVTILGHLFCGESLDQKTDGYCKSKKDCACKTWGAHKRCESARKKYGLEIGKHVNAGQQIGIVGPHDYCGNGNFDPHVHLGVRKAGTSTKCSGHWTYSGYLADSCAAELKDWLDPAKLLTVCSTYPACPVTDGSTGKSQPAAWSGRVAVSPASGKQGTTFSETCTGFTAKSKVLLHFRGPDGVDRPSVEKTTDGSGKCANTYKSSFQTMPGKWSFWGEDVSAGKKSAEVSFDIIDAWAGKVTVTPSSGKQGATFNEKCSGFTPNARVLLHFRGPDGVERQPVDKTTDGSGKCSNTYKSSTQTMAGKWTFWGEDSANGKRSPEVMFDVLPGK